MLKRFFCVILLVATIVSCASCTRDKSFTHADLTLTFDKDFREEKSEDYDLLVTNGKATAALSRLSFVDALRQDISATMSAQEFAEYMLLKTGKSATVFIRGDYAYYTYREVMADGEVYSMATFYRTAYAYVVVLYATSAVRELEYREKFFEYADSAVMSLDTN